jgi:hypothetical protein
MACINLTQYKLKWKHGCKPSIKGGEIIDQLRDYRLIEDRTLQKFQSTDICERYRVTKYKNFLEVWKRRFQHKIISFEFFQVPL